MSLSEVDRQLLQRCLDGAPRAWQDFADRFLGLVVHVANHAANSRGRTLDDATRDDLVAEVFLEFLRNDLAALRRFRRNCSLATYVTVIARRVIVRRLTVGRRELAAGGLEHVQQSSPHSTNGSSAQSRIEDADEVRRLMTRLDPQEANLVRMYHIEGKTYREISEAIGIAENSVGPALTRARAKMRQGVDGA